MNITSCKFCNNAKKHSIHTGFLTGIFHYCKCLERQIHEYPNPAGMKNEFSENIMMNMDYMDLIGMSHENAYHGLKLENLTMLISKKTCNTYKEQDELIIEQKKAMSFVDVDYFFKKNI
ncbi:hypothetical protein [Photobacterium indicum]|uniref:hypothetical protein n=1 Tax=Photobacterium indicum TaxID=81447 RepID=UPI003D0AD898